MSWTNTNKEHKKKRDVDSTSDEKLKPYNK